MILEHKLADEKLFVYHSLIGDKWGEVSLHARYEDGHAVYENLTGVTAINCTPYRVLNSQGEPVVRRWKPSFWARLRRVFR